MVSVYKITFNVVPEAREALEHLVKMTDMSKTDVLNRAVQVYRIVDELTRETGGLRVVRPDGSVEHIRLF